MAGTASSGSRRPTRKRSTRTPRQRRSHRDALHAALRRAGLLHELPEPDPDASDEFEPVAVRGEPVSESLIRERR